MHGLFQLLLHALDLVAFSDHIMESPNANLHCEEYLGWTLIMFADSGESMCFNNLGAHLIGPLHVRV